jgi:hypothetical protein
MDAKSLETQLIQDDYLTNVKAKLPFPHLLSSPSPSFSPSPQLIPLAFLFIYYKIPTAGKSMYGGSHTTKFQPLLPSMAFSNLPSCNLTFPYLFSSPSSQLIPLSLFLLFIYFKMPTCR